MKLYRAAIIQSNARNYVIALYANQISGKQLQIYTANIPILRVHQYPLIEQSAKCRLDVSSFLLVYGSYS